MAWFPCKSGTGMPSGLQTQMDAVLNKKFGTSTTYPATDWPDTVNLMGVLPVRTATKSAICSFSDGADSVPCPSVLCEINPLQASGTPSPSNPLPISGFTGLTLTNKDNISNPTHTDTYSVNWQSEAGTVYGGTLDVVSGVLTVTHARGDMGQMSWTKASNYNVMYANLGGVNTEYNAYCEIYLYSGTVTSAGGAYNKGNNTLSILTNDSRHLIYVRDDNYTDATTFTNSVNGHYLVYELATPVTYQLTPQEVTTLLATNNFFHDANGDTQVTYRADIDILINELGG